jgi:hypothetical protein
MAKKPQVMCMQRVCHISLESFWWRLQLCLEYPFNRRFTKSIGVQSGESPNFENFGTLDLRVPGKMTFGCRPWLVTKNIIKGKVMASPKSKQWWILWIHVCSWFVRAPKVLQLCTNQLVIWFVHVHMNNWPARHLS